MSVDKIWKRQKVFTSDSSDCSINLTNNFIELNEHFQKNKKANMTELIENVSDKNDLLFDNENFLLKSATTTMLTTPIAERTSCRFPVLAEDWRDNKQENFIDLKISSKILNRKITVVSDCTWKSTNLISTTPNFDILKNLDLKIVKKLKKKNKKLPLFNEKNMKENKTPSKTTKCFMEFLEQPCSSNTMLLTKHKTEPIWRLSMNTLEQSTPSDSTNCDCTFLAWTQLRNSRLKKKKQLNNNSNDDDTYRLKEVPKSDTESILLSPPNIAESLSLDSGLPSSISSSSSTSDQSGSTLDGHFTLRKKKDKNNENYLLSPDKLPAPYLLVNTERRLLYGHKFSTLLTNVVRKVFDISRKLSAIVTTTTELKNPSIVSDLVSFLFEIKVYA